jgi:hypothetical protein
MDSLDISNKRRKINIRYSPGLSPGDAFGLLVLVLVAVLLYELLLSSSLVTQRTRVIVLGNDIALHIPITGNGCLSV